MGEQMNMQALGSVFGFVLMAAYGFSQIFAEVDAIQYLTGFWSIVCWSIAFFVVYIPLVAQCLTYYGARYVWEWSLTGAVLLSFGPPLVIILIGVAGWLTNKVARR